MKVIHAEITGAGRGLLLHNPAGMGGSSNGKKQIPTPQAEAKAACYFMEDGKTLAVPGWNLFRSLVKAGGQFKNKKTSYSKIIAGGVSVEPDMLSLETTTYEIDTRRAVVQRQGILRSRPLLRTWTLKFDLLVNEEDVDAGGITILRAICEDAGRRVGLGDFRVEKNGPFGKFVVSAWEVADAGE
jgi:hypothetical protein